MGTPDTPGRVSDLEVVMSVPSLRAARVVPLPSLTTDESYAPVSLSRVNRHDPKPWKSVLSGAKSKPLTRLQGGSRGGG